MKKILMVCLGNICRSPLAHGILAQKLKERGLNYQVDSAGTGNWHVGQAPDKRSITVARQNGYDISQQKGCHFVPEFFDSYDLIFVMDKSNYADVIAQAKTADQRAKVRLFLPDAEVQDPYLDDTLFAPVFSVIEERCEALANELSNQK